MKIKFFSIIVIVFFASSLFAQLKSGNFYFDSKTPGYTLQSGNGERVFTKEVSFGKGFETKPKVFITNQMIDAADKTQIRYSVEAIAVSRDGFTIKVTTWADTKINSIGGSWLASAEKLVLKEEPIQVGKTIQLNNVFFEFNKADLKSDSYTELDQVVQFMKDNPTVEIEISGHTDNVGSDSYNLKLSQQRAESVVKYIVSKSIAANRLIAKGYGKDKPIASNATETGREQNRRVEFTIIKK